SRPVVLFNNVVRRIAAALALCGLMLAALLAPLAHLALVPHVTCAAHGELVHASATPAPQPESPLDDDAVDTGEGHDPCAMKLGTRATEPPPVVRTVLRAERAPDVQGAEREARPSLAMLEVAPKASPPA